jgi:uncharacterized protein YfbU (UPF0304 family)
MSIASFLVDELGRFEEFDGRIINSHMPTLQNYREIVRTVRPLLAGLHGRQLNTAELVLIFKKAG